MSQSLIENFKGYVNIHYSDNNITTNNICSNLCCSISCLHRALIHNYGYSIMKYVEYFRILKSIELIGKGEKKVYYMVGYNSPSVFSKSFLRITGCNARCFCPYQLIDHKSIIKTALNEATENPKKAVENIIKDISIKTIFSKRQKKTRKDNLKTKKDKSKINLLKKF